MNVIVRDYDEANDSGYLYSTWTKFAFTLDKKLKKASNNEKNIFFLNKRAEIRRYLDQGKAKIACLEADPGIILGYAVAFDGEIVWKCVKKDFHHMGIDQLLLNSLRGYLYERGKEPNQIGEAPRERASCLES